LDKTGWEPVAIEYGEGVIKVLVPPWCDILGMRAFPALKNPEKQIEASLSDPVGGPPVKKLVASFESPPGDLTVAVAVSDNTRPVPYNGEAVDGILLPLLKRLEKAGVKRKHITVIVGTGTHAPTSTRWKKRALGRNIFGRYAVVDHDCTSPDLVSIGKVGGVEVKIDDRFMRAGMRVVTGLVEPHFMAGFSGGRKAVCPGLVNIEATRLFHGGAYTDDPNAASLILQNNPCHEFALEVARRAGVHFSINAVLNNNMRLAGVFAGGLEKAHLEAAKTVGRHALVRADREYDVVLTHGGRVAVNHYQAAKAAYAAAPVIKRGGTVILVSSSSDPEPVGKPEYKKTMAVLKECGIGEYSRLIRSDGWIFTPDQWQAQKWDQFFQKIGSFEGLIYCTTNIGPSELRSLPGRPGYDFIENGIISIECMVQNAIDETVQKVLREQKTCTMAYVKDGPYGVPSLSS